MNAKDIIDYFKRKPQDFPLGYSFIEIKKPSKINVLSSVSLLHNSERYLGGIYYKELSNVHKYK